MAKIKQKINRLFYKTIQGILCIIDAWWARQKIAGLNNITNLLISKNVTINGVPTVVVHQDAKISIGDEVLLNSKQDWCLLGAYGPIRLLADHAGAEIHIGSQTRIHASCIRAYQLVSIGKRCLVASNCQITDTSGHALSFPDVEQRIQLVCNESSPVVIEDDVWLCEGVKVLPGVTIGKGTVVAAGSVVTKSLPSYCLAGGIPARAIKTFR
jgi:acetyltransferase-like isoleucine patch superfamily enzyme